MYLSRIGKPVVSAVFAVRSCRVSAAVSSAPPGASETAACVCVCARACVCMRVCGSVHGSVLGCANAWMHGWVWVHGCMGAWVCECVGVWMCGCVGVWVRMSMRTCMCASARARACVCVCTCDMILTAMLERATGSVRAQPVGLIATTGAARARSCVPMCALSDAWNRGVYLRCANPLASLNETTSSVSLKHQQTSDCC